MTVDKSHGSPFDRGAADGWFGRRSKPHKFLTPTGGRDYALTDDEKFAYFDGFDSVDGPQV